jgi:hypothetical protein
MNDNRAHKDAQRRVTNWLHPRVYMLVIALTAWFALAIWSFAGSGVVDYLLFIVSGFMFVAVALPLILSRVGHADPAAPHGDEPPRDAEPSLREWAAADYDTWTGRLKGAQAAAEILLPIAAAAVGMTVIGLLFRIAEHAVA